ncbi:MAG: tyrosine-type recombinase/integrase [Rhizobiaceae bacterium]
MLIKKWSKQMATIRKIPSGNWNAQIRFAGKRSRSKSFPSEHEARKWADDTERSLRERKRIQPPTTPTWKEMGLIYCERMLMGKPSQAETIRRVERIGNHKLFQKPFTSISTQDVNAFKQDRLRSICTTTCHHELATIKRVFRWADREAQADGKKPIPNPCDLVTLPKPKRPRDKVIERHELELLLTALTPIIAKVVEFAYETAMRRSEIVKLRLKHFHPEQRLVSVVNGKEGDRSVPLSTRAVEILKDASKTCYSQESRIFEVAADSLTQALRRARRKFGLSEDIRFHQLRHTRCTLVARKGFNQAQMMVVTGHKDIRSVQRYTHLNASDVVKLLD